MSEQSIKDKTVKGVGWSGIDNVVKFGVSFLVSIVLARLLSPDDYGLIGIITIVTTVCTALVNGGFSTALIRKKDVSDADYNTSFVVNLGISIFLYFVVFIFSPYIASFFNREELTSLIRVASIGIIIGALSLVQQTRLTKRIDFKTQTKITLVASFLSGAIGIIMALFGYGVWSLVVQGLSQQLFSTGLLFIYNKWLPSFVFSLRSFNELFGFGWKMMLSQLLDTVWKELYQVVVGRFYTPSTLGQYTRANQFSTIFSSNITIVIQRVTYPVLSDLQDNKQRMTDAYRRILKVTMFLTAIPMFFLGAISEPLLYCLIGPKWIEASTYLPLICIAGSLYPLHAINLNMLQVQGRSDLFLYLEIIKKIIALLPLFIGAFVGIIPMLYVNVITGVIAYFLNSSFSGKYLGYTSWRQLKDIAPSYVIALLVSVPVFFLKFIPVSFWIILPIQLLLGAFLFFSACRISKINEYDELKSILKPYVRNMRFHIPKLSELNRN